MDYLTFESAEMRFLSLFADPITKFYKINYIITKYEH